MSGIGFELKKLFSDKESAFTNIKGLVSAVAVTVSPWIMTAISLNIILIISNVLKLSKADETLFMSSIFYVFMFSQILTLTFQHFVSKYITNCIYERKLYKIRSMFLGKTKILTIVAFLLSYLFIKRSTMSENFKAIYIFLFVLMTLSWFNLIFISLLKKFKIIVWSFIAGSVVSIIFGYIFLNNSIMRKEMVTLMLLSYAIGIFVNFTITSMYILRAFPGKSKNQFEYLNYFKGNMSLIFIGLFHTLSVWGHVFANWITGDAYTIGRVFIVSPLYEMSIFYSCCTVIPSVMYFSIFMETKFLPLYEDCRQKIFYLEEKEESISNVKKLLHKEMLRCMEVQFLISLSSILIGNILFNYLKISTYNLNLFYVMVFASFSIVFISILTTLFLYFNLKMLVLVINGVLMILSFLLSMIFGNLGVKFTGLGFFVSTFIVYIIVLIIFLKVFEQLAYIMNFRQDMRVGGGKPLRKLSFLLDKKIYIIILIFLLLSLSLSAAYDKKGFNAKTGNNWHTMSKFDTTGYDIEGYDKEGINERGFNREHINVYTNSRYDEGGFDYRALHKDTGNAYDLYNFDVNHINKNTKTLYNERGFDYKKINKDTKRPYDLEGWDINAVHEKTGTTYNPEGWNINGINQRNFNKQGYNIITKTMYDENDFDINANHKVTKKPYDERRFDVNQINIDTKTAYDSNGFDYRAIHKDTGTKYDKNGWNYEGIHQKTNTKYNPEGYNRLGYDKNGWNSKGIHQKTNTKYNPDGYDKNGYDKNGWSPNGIHYKTNTKYSPDGYDRNGYDKNGWSYSGIHYKTNTKYNPDGYDRNDRDKDGYKRGERPVPKPEPKHEPRPEPKVETKPKVQRKPEVRQPKVEIKPKPKVQPKTEIKSTVKPSNVIQTKKDTTKPYDRHGFDENGVYIKGGFR